MDVILVINAGSSSIKFHAFAACDGELDPIAGGKLEEIYTTPRFQVKRQSGEVIDEKCWPEGERLGHDNAIAFLLDWLRGHAGDTRLLAVGHRVVHGGDRYSAPVRVDANVLAELEALIPLAPLHQPHNLAAIRSIQARDPRVPQIACFDTAFHHTQPAMATRFALPPEITRRGVRRYGFHGLSYEYIANVLPQYDERAAHGRTVVLHLGNGASMTALHHGKSVASTMGFTAVEGLVMGTRSGSLDPGVVLWMMEEARMDARAIATLLYKRSGLLGVSGISSDMRTLLASDSPAAAEAVELFCYRIARELGSLAAALGGLDAIVFTAGIGEYAAPVRERVCRAAAWLGVSLDAQANARHGPRISDPHSAVDVWVIPTNEERMIARHALHRLEG
ncbi:acetate/propionate family kinase (plasmid) [Ralstonia syzygii subsp. celebesensis]|uniref:Acetate kinase n=3 Tax=Ralstonia solanacearum species complex TaxID=3116862 RepID=A0AAD0WIN8_RALSL|nr:MULTISPECIES: acetate/propionate family kinase [Ralstonia solanacearum species complex]CCA82499.1 acetate kinase [blood disease bacterium R229]AQW31800.1 acetate kinase [blood disease bacterium A2-HR MARDI]AXV84365.1 acetate/propionate family kinase [Ralstonia solanacearum]AXW55498.1 acetate/propionate family kinase [Ralstonia solanacearum]QQV57206.1 acetate/propionate family kinase [Ralstonia syzygii subsp. celebesensis]